MELDWMVWLEVVLFDIEENESLEWWFEWGDCMELDGIVWVFFDVKLFVGGLKDLE